MALEMREACEACGAHLDPSDEAYICTFECTWCAVCVSEFGTTCPNCQGELVRRPRPPQA